MSTPDGKFKLRGMLPSDSAAIVDLLTEFDGDLTTRFLVDAFAAITAGTKDETQGVVVEHAGQDGLVGMGTVRYSRVQFNDEVLPLAFLDGLKVHKDFRGQGIGFQIASWRVRQARERLGSTCVIATGMLQDNHASRAVARKWSRELLDPVCGVLILPVRKRAPQAADGIQVCAVEPAQFEEFAEKQNQYYRHYNLYTPAAADRMENTLAVTVEGRKPYRFYAAVDRRGNLLAGAQTWARGLIKADTVNQVPAPLRLLNPLLGVLPPDNVIRDVTVSELWYAPGQQALGGLLWESIRWLCRDQGTTVVTAFDPRDPTRHAVSVRPWHQPWPVVTMAVAGPQPIARDQLITPIHRV